MLDVTIVADNADLYQAHQHKCDFYDQPGIRDWVSRNVSTPSPTFSPVTLNWRGLLAPPSEEVIRMLGLSASSLSLLSAPVSSAAPVSSTALVSQRSWVRFPFEPEFFQVSSFQLLKLKHFHCDDLHIILSLSAVQICDYFIYSYSLKISLSDLLVMLAL